jgi:hypothetical protein
MEINLNLASKPYLNRQSVRLWLLLAGLFMLLLLILNCIYGFLNYRQLQLLGDRFQELEVQVSTLQGVPAGYTPEAHAALVGEVALANEIVTADQFRWTVLLDRFEKLIPADVSIRSIQPDFAKRTVQLACVAQDVSAMTRFVDNLLTSADLNQAYLQRHGEVVLDIVGGKQVLVGFSLEIREAF